MITVLWTFLLSLGAATIRIFIPYVMAALGGTVSERSGVVNIALEGFLLLTALGTALLAPYGVIPAILGGLFVGLLCAALYGLLVVILRGDPIVCGVAFFLLADGLSRFLLKVVFGSTSNSPRLSALAGHWTSLFLLLAILSTLALYALLSRTIFGLRLRAVGQHPKAARSLGVAVTPVRFVAVLLSGLLSAVGGIWLVFDQRQFVALMSGGRGFIALAAMILGRREPLWVACAALLFAFAEALGIGLQAQGLPVPNWTLQLIPYTVTILALLVQRHPYRPSM